MTWFKKQSTLLRATNRSSTIILRPINLSLSEWGKFSGALKIFLRD